MTAPRTALFQRPGGSPSKGSPAPEGSAQDNAEAPPEGVEPVTCPQCGCVFDPETMEPVEQPGDVSGVGVPDALSAMLAGGAPDQPQGA